VVKAKVYFVSQMKARAGAMGIPTTEQEIRAIAADLGIDVDDCSSKDVTRGLGILKSRVHAKPELFIPISSQAIKDVWAVEDTFDEVDNSNSKLAVPVMSELPTIQEEEEQPAEQGIDDVTILVRQVAGEMKSITGVNTLSLDEAQGIAKQVKENNDFAVLELKDQLVVLENAILTYFQRIQDQKNEIVNRFFTNVNDKKAELDMQFSNTVQSGFSRIQQANVSSVTNQRQAIANMTDFFR
jgi:hypothetical protein